MRDSLAGGAPARWFVIFVLFFLLFLRTLRNPFSLFRHDSVAEITIRQTKNLKCTPLFPVLCDRDPSWSRPVGSPSIFGYSASCRVALGTSILLRGPDVSLLPPEKRFFLLPRLAAGY